MAVQYNSDNNSWETWIDVFRNKIPEASNDAKKAFEDIQKKLSEGFVLDSYDDFINANKLADESLINFLKDTKYSQKDLTSYQQYLKDAGKSTSTFTTSIKKASTAIKSLGAAMASMAVNWMIGKAIDFVATGIDNLIHKSEKEREKLEEIAEKAEEAKSNIKSLSDELKSKTKTVNDIKNRYAELAQGVNSFTGENKALSTEDYEEFLNLNEQLLKIFPDLTYHYNSNGDAIANLSGSVNTIVDSLDNLIDKQRELANQEIADNLPKVLEGVQAQSDAYEKEIEEKQKELNATQKIHDRLNSFNFKEESKFGINSLNRTTLTISNLPSDDELRNQMLSVYESAIKDVELKLGEKKINLADRLYTKTLADENTSQIVFNLQDIEDQDEVYEKILESIQSKTDEYYQLTTDLSKEIQNLEEKNKANWQGLNNDILGWVTTTDDYKILGDNARSTVQSIINNLDFSNDEFKGITMGDLQDKISKQILNVVNGDNDERIQELFNQLFSDENIDVDSLNSIYVELLTYFGDNPIPIQFVADKLNTQRKNNNQIAKSLLDGKTDLKSDRKTDLKGLTDEQRAQYFNGETYEQQLETYEQQLETWVDHINDKEKYDLLMGVRIPDDVLYGTEENFAEWYKSLKNETTSSPITLEVYLANDKELQDRLIALQKTGKLDADVIQSFAEYDKMLELCDGDAGKLLDTIEEISNQKFSNPINTANNLSKITGGLDSLGVVYDKATIDGFVDSDAITSLYEQFGDLDVFNDFVHAMQNIGEEGQDLQKVFNDLVTSYIDSKVSLGELSEATKQQYIEELKLNGVTNAEQVVTERLAYMQDLAGKALSTLQEHNIGVAYSAQDLSNATADEIQELINQAEAAGVGSEALRILKLHKEGVNKVKIETTNDVNELLALVQAAGGAAILTSATATGLEMLKNGQATGPTAEGIIKAAKEELMSLFDLGEIFTPLQYAGNQQKDNSTEDNNNDSTKEDAKTEINWIERRLEQLQKNIDVTKAKFDNLFTVKAKSNNLDEQIKQTTALMNAQGKAAEKYKKKAEDYAQGKTKKKYKKKADKYAEESKLPESLQKAVQEGRLENSSFENLIKEYGQDTAERISKYKEYWDKYKNAALEEEKLVTEIRKLKEQQYQLYVDEADANIEKIHAKAENDTDDFKTQNKYLKKQVEWINLRYESEIAIANLNKDKVKAAQLEAEWAEKLAQLEVQKFENIGKDYDYRIQILDEGINAAKRSIDELEASGNEVTAQLYKTQKSIYQSELETLNQELRELEKQLNNIPEGTSEWYKAKSDIETVKDSISKTTTEIYKLNNAVNELHFAQFEKLRTKISRVPQEFEFLNELIADRKKIDEDTSQFTTEGLTNLGVNAIGYYSSIDKQNVDKAELDELRKMLAEGKLSNSKYDFNSPDDLKDKIDELYDTWQSDIKDTYNYRKRLADAMTEKYQAQLTLAQDLVNKKKESLNLEKDLHNYQRTVANQVKDINTLQMQITAYRGDTSQEGMAKLQSLQKSLMEAEENLRETEYDRYISDQEDMLDDIYTEYEELISKKLDDFQGLVEEGLRIANSNSEEIKTALNKIAEDNNYDIQNASITNNSGSNLETSVDDNTRAIFDEEDRKQIEQEEQERQDRERKEAEAENQKRIQWEQEEKERQKREYEAHKLDEEADARREMEEEAAARKEEEAIAAAGKAGREYLGAKTFSGGTFSMAPPSNAKLRVIAKDYIESKKDPATKNINKYSDVNQKIYNYTNGNVLTVKELKELAALLGVKYDKPTKDGNLYKKLKQIEFPGFSKGGVIDDGSVFNVLSKQTYANGDSTIVSAQSGERILTPVQNENFEKFINSDFVKNPFNYINIPDLSESNHMPQIIRFSNDCNNNLSINIEKMDLPNVLDPESFGNELANQLQNNQKIQEITQCITYNGMLGNPVINVRHIH